MSQVTDKRHKLVTVTLTALLAALLLSAPAVAIDPIQEYLERAALCPNDSFCPDGTTTCSPAGGTPDECSGIGDGTCSGPSCGGIVYGNSGAYVVGKVEVTALGQDKQLWDNNPNCEDLHLANGTDLAVGEFGVFEVPAPCSYRLTIHIAAGSTTNKHVFVTPGCQILLISKGSTYNGNQPKFDSAKWAKAAADQLREKWPHIKPSRIPVTDKKWHEKLNETEKHYCNKDSDANKNPN
jgi:hypothetical protein